MTFRTPPPTSARLTLPDEILAVGIGVRLANELVALGLTIHHIMIGSFAEVAGMSFLTMHHEDGRTNLINIIEETSIRVSLDTYGTPTII